MAKNKEREPFEKRRVSAAALQLATAFVCLLLGALLTFVPEVDVRLLCYIFCALLVAAGVAEIVYYFVTGGYRRLEDYNFVLGILLLALACCGFARIESLEAAFRTCMAFAALLLGVITLQNAVQLRLVGSRLWLVSLIFTALILFGAISVLMDFRALWDALHYWIFLVSGALGAISLAIAAGALRGAAKQRAAEDAAPPPPPPPEPAPRTEAPAHPAPDVSPAPEAENDR